MTDPSHDDLQHEVEQLRARVTALESERASWQTGGHPGGLTILDAVFRALHQGDLASALDACILTVCAHTGWVLGEAWMPNRDGELVLQRIHVGPNADAKRLESFIAVSRRTKLGAGVGLPGAVLERHARVWIPDIDGLHPGRFPRVHEAKAAGLHAALGIPVMVEGEVAAVLAFYADSAHAEDQARVDLVSSLAQQLGLVLRHERARQRIAELESEAAQWSTPVLQVWDGVAIAPIVGDLDAARMAQLQERVLSFLEKHRAKVVLVDVTGVPEMETWVAQELLSLARGARMLGAQAILTGIRPPLARTLVHLGVSFEEIGSESSLAAGLRTAIALLAQPTAARVRRP